MKNVHVNQVYRNSLTDEQIQEIVTDAIAVGLNEFFVKTLLMTLTYYGKMVGSTFGLSRVIEFDFRQRGTGPDGKPSAHLSLLIKNPTMDDGLCLYIKLHKGDDGTAGALHNEFANNQFTNVYTIPTEKNVSALNSLPHYGLRRAVKDLVLELGKGIVKTDANTALQHAHLNLEDRGIFKMYHHFPDEDLNITIQTVLVPIIEWTGAVEGIESATMN